MRKNSLPVNFPQNSLNSVRFFNISARPGDHAPFLETHGNSVILGRSGVTLVSVATKNIISCFVSGWRCLPLFHRQNILTSNSLDTHQSRSTTARHIEHPDANFVASITLSKTCPPLAYFFRPLTFHQCDSSNNEFCGLRNGYGCSFG